MQTATENTTTVDNTRADYEPKKGDRVYLRRASDTKRYGIQATIVSSRHLADDTYRTWFRYTDEQTGEECKDYYDIAGYHFRRHGKNWSRMFRLVAEATADQRAYYAQSVYNRAERRAEMARQIQAEQEYMEKFKAENQHLVDRAPVWHPVEVVEYTPRRFEPTRDSRGVRLGLIIREVIVRRERWHFYGYGERMRVRSEFTTIKCSVVRGNDGQWRISTLPSHVEFDTDFQAQMVKLIAAAHDWCVERNAIERDRIDSLRAWRQKQIAA